MGRQVLRREAAGGRDAVRRSLCVSVGFASLEEEPEPTAQVVTQSQAAYLRGGGGPRAASQVHVEGTGVDRSIHR